MEEVAWSLVSLVVAGAALVVIGAPISVGVGRVVRTIAAHWALQRHNDGASHPVLGTSQETAAGDVGEVVLPASPALAAAAPPIGTVTVTSAYGPRERLAAETTPGTLPLPYPAAPTRWPRTPEEIAPLERALTTAMRARQVPACVLAAIEAGVVVMPGRYPWLPREELLDAEALATVFGDESWARASRVHGVGPMHATSNGWN